MKLSHTLLVTALATAGAAHAQITPIDITNSSFNQDVIISGIGGDGVTGWVGGGTTAQSNLNAPGSGYHYAGQTYATANGYGGSALPDNGTIASGDGSGATFQLQPYNEANDLEVEGASETLTLATPGYYSDVSFLLNNVAANATASFTLNFVGGSTDTVTTNAVVPYWVSGSPSYSTPTESAGVAVTLNPLEIYNGTSDVQDGTSVQFDEYDFVLSGADQGKQLASITVDGSSNNLQIYAVSGVAIPEPSAWAMLLAGAGVLLFAGRLRRGLSL
jgi:hypothetical protein